MLRRAVLAALLPMILVASLSAQTPPPLQPIKTVWIILMENHSWSAIKGNSSAPYINNTLLPMASHAEQYFTPPGNHPSLPNYLWLQAGKNFGITTDCLPSACEQNTTAHLDTQLNNAGISWKAYEENIDGTTCPLADNYPYKQKHNPFIYFSDVTNNLDTHSAYCIAHERPFTELATDIQNNNVAAYNFITPNMCDDMHDSCSPTNNPVKQGDTWLSNNVPTILNSTAYQTGGALFIVWDEGTSSSDGPIGMIVLSPFAKGGGFSNSIHYTHSSTLKTFEEIFNQPLLGDAGSSGTNDLSDLFMTPASPPSAPTNLTATAGNQQVSLSWTASTGTGAITYNVKRATVSGGPYTTVATGVSGTTYTNTGLTNGTTYFFVVSASNSAGESPNSNQASATPFAAPPPAPTNLAASAGNAQVSLTWTASPSATSYNVKRGTASGGPYTTIASGVTTTSYIDMTVTNGTTYFYVVTAVNANGESGNSNEASATPTANLIVDFAINAGGPAVTPFSADSFFSGGSTGSITNTVDTSHVTNPAPMAVYQTRRFSTAPATFSYTFTGLMVGVQYTVRLHFNEHAKTAAGQREFNVSINGTEVLTNFDIFAAAGGKDIAVIEQFTTFPDSSGDITIVFSPGAIDNPLVNGIQIEHGGGPPPPPPAPTGLTATPGDTQVALSWTASSDATSYNVKRGTVSGGPYTTVGSGITTTSFTDTGLTNGTTYFYVVSAVNSGGESPNSNEANATPVANPTVLFAINSGGPAVSPFSADNFFSGGSTGSITNTVDTSHVTNPAPMAVYQTRRFATAPATFSYTFTGLMVGVQYTVRLHFNEHAKTAAGKREFNVTINNVQVLTNFDIFATAGGQDIAVIETFSTVADSSGNITILFSPGAIDNPLVNGIQIER